MTPYSFDPTRPLLEIITGVCNAAEMKASLDPMVRSMCPDIDDFLETSLNDARTLAVLLPTSISFTLNNIVLMDPTISIPHLSVQCIAAALLLSQPLVGQPTLGLASRVVPFVFVETLLLLHVSTTLRLAPGILLLEVIGDMGDHKEQALLAGEILSLASIKSFSSNLDKRIEEMMIQLDNNIVLLNSITRGIRIQDSILRIKNIFDARPFSAIDHLGIISQDSDCR